MRATTVRDQVREFHRVFVKGEDPEAPTLRDEEVRELRVNLIEEELKEFKDALEAGDIVEVADAIGDLLYVVEGAALAFGIDMRPISAEIHRSNMTKLWRLTDIQRAKGPVTYEVATVSPETGQPCGWVGRRQDGKAVKPPSYSPAVLAPLLREQGWLDDS